MINDTLQHRQRVIAVIITAVIVIYILRLFSLQIIESRYKEGADSNAFLRKTIYPPRGLIYDRNGVLLVYNKPAYDVTLIMREIQNLDTLALCKSLNISKSFFIERIKEIKDRSKNIGYSSYTPQIFMSQLEIQDIATFQQSMYKYPGFYIQNRTLREYAYPNAAHVLGNIGEVTQRRIDKDNYYKPGDYAGRDGIEFTYEKSLRGDKGMEILLRDVKGRIKGRFEDGKKDIPAKAGQNLTVTLDIKLQVLAEKLMRGKVGSVVAIEPSTGEILALVSSPAFDPSILVGRKRTKNYRDLLNDPIKPLMNRATQAQYSPGSTFKPLQALVCLEMGGISEQTVFSCSGPASKPIKCTHSHGSPVGLVNAIEQSCNPYFWYAFRNAIERDGYGTKNLLFRTNYDVWVNHVKSFGLGEKYTETDIYEQARGYVPTQKFYNRVYRSETGWRAITIRSNSIGQGEILTTPLQLANSMAAIANQGFYITPHLHKSDTMLKKKHYVNIDKKYYPIVFEGLAREFDYGTARFSRLEGLSLCGKTGTVQNPHGKDHSLFVGFAPRENPKIAIAIAVENAGYGSVYAAPIFSLLVEQYLLGKVSRIELEERITNLVTNIHVKER